MVGCPGGVILPIAKKWFFVESFAFTKSFKGVYQEGPNKGRPGDLLELMLGLCTPMEACLGYNMCGRPYINDYCSSCRFKYYKPKGKATCKACGYEQKVGVSIMAGVITMLTIGALSFAVILMKYK
jgi:hypothetical protein